MSISAEKCRESALKYGCDESVIFTPNDIDSKFYKRNKEILDADRGAGYWLWKPYFFYRELQSLGKDEILMYTDAGLLFLNPVELLLREFDELMLFGNRWTHGDWCKRDVLMEMECEKFADKEQLQASCIISRKTEDTLNFFSQWLEWCQMAGFIDDSESKTPNKEGFREHRHDQAILTNLAYLHRVKFNWWPVQYNVRHRHKYDNKYPIMFFHHRYRNHEFKEDRLGITKWING